jgi:hypothetical protein
MPFALSVLDLSPIPSRSKDSEALWNTLDLAQLADELGYHRYWLAEHHSMIDFSLLDGCRARGRSSVVCADTDAEANVEIPSLDLAWLLRKTDRRSKIPSPEAGLRYPYSSQEREWIEEARPFILSATLLR